MQRYRIMWHRMVCESGHDDGESSFPIQAECESEFREKINPDYEETECMIKI